MSVDLEKLKELHQEKIAAGQYLGREDIPPTNRILEAMAARIGAGRKLRDALQEAFPAIVEELEGLRAYRDQAEAGRETVEHLLVTVEQAKAELFKLKELHALTEQSNNHLREELMSARASLRQALLRKAEKAGGGE